MIPEDLKKQKAGGRPSNHSLLLSEPEYEWLHGTITKRSQLVKKSTNAKLAKTVLALADKLVIPVAATSPNEGYVLKLSRDELQVVNLIVGNTVTGLRDKIIPEYQSRAADSPRLIEATQLLVLLLGLQNKGTRIYDAGSHRRGNGRVQKS